MARTYVGIKHNRQGREVFTHDATPTESSHPTYAAVIGPFRTTKAAALMAEPSAGSNPHLRTVGDAERIATVRTRLGF